MAKNPPPPPFNLMAPLSESETDELECDWTDRKLRLNPRYQHWSVAMIERMGQDLVFDHAQAARDFAFQPKGFVLAAEDVPA